MVLYGIDRMTLLLRPWKSKKIHLPLNDYWRLSDKGKAKLTKLVRLANKKTSIRSRKYLYTSTMIYKNHLRDWGHLIDAAFECFAEEENSRAATPERSAPEEH